MKYKISDERIIILLYFEFLQIYGLTMKPEV